LGLLNSRLLDWVLKRLSSPFRGSYFAYSRQYIERLPIRIVDCRDLGEGELCGQIGQAAKRMIDLTARTDAARTDHERENLQRQLEMTDRKIDRLVYELYGLTVDEIHIVEEAPRL
jgi:hypothetical protein